MIAVDKDIATTDITAIHLYTQPQGGSRMTQTQRQAAGARSSAVDVTHSHGGAAATMTPLLSGLLDLGPDAERLRVRFEFWDGTALGPSDTSNVLQIHSPDALRRIVWSPNELGIARAYVSGDIDFAGDIFDVVMALRDVAPSRAAFKARQVAAAVAAAQRIGALGKPLPPPPEEAHPHGWRHSLRRDATVISHHYDVGNDFYRLVLGETMTYSCARFTSSKSTLADAQRSKHELVCRKLGLTDRPGQRLLDVGCGWGEMAIHAAVHHGTRVVGITLSDEQATLAKSRVAEAGVGDLVDIQLRDYREMRGETFDAISSIGMFEHVGGKRASTYFSVLRSLLGPHGRLMNHAISSVNGSKLSRRGFIYRYVFPDGELLDVGYTQLLMEQAGFEVRDVESLREHYAMTLRHWVANLRANWDRAVELVGVARARVWLLYMAASVVGFEDGGINIHQVLGVVPDEAGSSGMPRTRDAWATPRVTASATTH